MKLLVVLNLLVFVICDELIYSNIMKISQLENFGLNPNNPLDALKILKLNRAENVNILGALYGIAQILRTYKLTLEDLLKVTEESLESFALTFEEEKILEALLPKNLSTQVFRAMLESFASEQGARMTAMDNATRNAGDMINTLSITYNRSRQAQITKELIEIISGAEAL